MSTTLTDAQQDRIVKEFLESHRDKGPFTESDVLDAIRQMHDIRVSAAVWALWDAGDLTIGYRDGELTFFTRGVSADD